MEAIHSLQTMVTTYRTTQCHNLEDNHQHILDNVSVAEHFQQAGLSVFNNNWSSVHDFTPIEGENNWCLFPNTIRIQDYVSLPASQELQRCV
jgi:hypothetical protein